MPDPNKPRKQVAALPVRFDAKGHLHVLLITSRGTQRFIIPKGWPMKGKKDHRAAAIEAQQEAGIIGRVHKKPVGVYTYWKRRDDHFDFCRVKVYPLEFRHQLPDWREKGQRRGAWLLPDEAADLVDDPGLVDIIRNLPRERSPDGKRRRKKAGASIPS